MARSSSIFVLLTVALLAGCASSHKRPPPLIVPSARITASYFSETSRSGLPTSNPQSISFKGALELQATWSVFRHSNFAELPLLASNARLITADAGGNAVLPSGVLTSNARITWNEAQALHAVETNEHLVIGESRAVLPFDTTVSFRATDGEGSPDVTLNTPQRRFIQISLARSANTQQSQETLQLGVTVQNHPPQDPRSRVFQTETALTSVPLHGDPAYVLVVLPFRFSGSDAIAAAGLVKISRGKAGPDFQKLVEQCKTSLATPALQEHLEPMWAQSLRRALDSLNQSDLRRAALVYMAGQSNAEICLDVASVCDDAMLAHISNSIKTDAAAALNSADRGRLAWILDSASVTAMQPLLYKATLPPELLEVLTIHMGEPGRHAAALDDIMRSAASEQDFLNRLVAENYIYLEDNSPASRVRAFEWLQKHKMAPVGFKPLAPAKQRRIALDNALAQQTQVNAAQGAP